MKKLVIIALLAIGISGFAQEMKLKHKKENKEQLSPEQRNERQLKKLTSELNLSAKQQTQIGDLLKEQKAKREAMMATKKNRVTEPTKEERMAMKKQMMAEKEANEAKIKSILDAKQYEKYEALKVEQRGKVKEKVKNHKKGGGDSEE